MAIATFVEPLDFNATIHYTPQQSGYKTRVRLAHTLAARRMKAFTSSA